MVAAALLAAGPAAARPPLLPIDYRALEPQPPLLLIDYQALEPPPAPDEAPSPGRRRPGAAPEPPPEAVLPIDPGAVRAPPPEAFPGGEIPLAGG